MSKIWVLDTETKGTGAEMVPLERALERKRSAPKEERVKVVRRTPAAREAARDAHEEAAPREPSGFKGVSVLSGQVLAEDAEARQTVLALAGLRSMFDVRIYVRESDGWRPLTISEQKLLWEFRDRVAAAA